MSELSAKAVVFEQPERLAIRTVALQPPAPTDVVVDIQYSGISTGTERLLWTGAMPEFPGMGYPLVPGYESIGVVVDAGTESGCAAGETVFVPGARCFVGVNGLFGGAASRVVVAGSRVLPVPETLGADGVLLALAATAHHALQAPAGAGEALPELIVGHGVVGRLLARLTQALSPPGSEPVRIWERDINRRHDPEGSAAIDPAEDERHDYHLIIDASGDADLLDTLIGRLGHGGEIVLAGFYHRRPSFDFPAAFIREIRLRVAAQWQRGDLEAVRAMVETKQLGLDGLITHRTDADQAESAYLTAFGDSACLKMILDWRGVQ